MKLIILANVLLVASAQTNCDTLRDTWAFCYTWEDNCNAAVRQICPQTCCRADIAKDFVPPQSSAVDMQRCLMAGAVSPVGSLAQMAFTNGDDRLGWRLFEKLVSSTGNFVFSPLSIYVGLGMLSDGARGLTQMQLYQAMFPAYQGQSSLVVYQYATTLQSLNTQTTANIGLSMVNALFADQTFLPQQQFSERLIGCFANDVKLRNFRTSAEQTRLEANQWVANATRGFITNILPPGSITANSRLVMLNAVYLNASWAMPFQLSYRSGSTQLGFSVPMMSGFQIVRYMVDPASGDVLIGVPYENEQMMMWIVIPLLGQTKSTIEINSCQFSDWKARAMARAPVRATLQMPEFRMGYNMRLKQDLQSIGVTDMFSPTADFTGMTVNERPYVSTAEHRSFIEVTKRGTQGATMTGIGLETTVAPNIPIRIVVNRPFIFTVDHIPSKMTLLMGKVSNVQ